MYELLIKQIPVNWYNYLFKPITFKNDFQYFKILHKNKKMKKK